MLVNVAQAAQAPERRSDTPLLGRQAELAKLEAAFTRVTAEARCEVVLIVGEPGIGKTRLAQELSAWLGRSAQVLNGHCTRRRRGFRVRAVR